MPDKHAGSQLLFCPCSPLAAPRLGVAGRFSLRREKITQILAKILVAAPGTYSDCSPAVLLKGRVHPAPSPLLSHVGAACCEAPPTPCEGVAER